MLLGSLSYNQNRIKIVTKSVNSTLSAGGFSRLLAMSPVLSLYKREMFLGHISFQSKVTPESTIRLATWKVKDWKTGWNSIGTTVENDVIDVDDITNDDKNMSVWNDKDMPEAAWRGSTDPHELLTTCGNNNLQRNNFTC